MGPWCYTNIPTAEKSYCSITPCTEPQSGCKQDLRGINYQGNAPKTRSGYLCLPWEMMNNSKKAMPNGSAHEVRNLCRNTDNDKYGPFCWYYDKNGAYAKEACGIPICNVSDEINDI